MRLKWIVLGLILLSATATIADVQPGNIDIRSTLVGTRVYLDDAYVGDADIFLEDVPTGDHVIIMRQGSQRIRGEFTVKPGELLMLEGRFDESRIVDLRKIAQEEAAKRAEAARKAEVEQKAEPVEPKKEEKRVAAKVPEKKKPPEKKIEKKKAVVALAKPAKGGAEDPRELHVNLLRVDFNEAPDTVDMKITPRINQSIITNFNDSTFTSGKLYRSKQNYVLCEGSGCSRDWTGRFFYFDDTGKRDAFLIRWRETVFTGITPQGTSKIDVDMCVNGDCKRVSLAQEGSAAQSTVDRYVLNLSKTALTVRRADLMKEITDAGGKVPDF